MTQEEKSKRYDEALEKARQLCAYPTSNPFISDLQDLFPELKESEDESIRKRLIELLKKNDEQHYAKEIAWLEAQGEQKPAWSEEDKNTLDFFVDYLLDTIKKMPAEEYAGGLGKAVVLLKSLKDKVLPQPKQKWKQENTGDLTDFENVMMHIGISFFGKNAGLNPNDTNAIKEQANLLLELVPKQEWSEEDEENRKNILYILNQLKGTAIYKEDKTAENCIDWLKSLKPQSHWKPSDEQIKALEHAINCYSGISPINIEEVYALEIMKDQLKKLREE